MGEYATIRFFCETHLDAVVSAGSSNEIFVFDPQRKEYALDPSNMYCTGFDPSIDEHKFVIELVTSDGVTIKVPMPEPKK